MQKVPDECTEGKRRVATKDCTVLFTKDWIQRYIKFFQTDFLESILRERGRNIVFEKVIECDIQRIGCLTNFFEKGEK